MVRIAFDVPALAPPRLRNTGPFRMVRSLYVYVFQFLVLLSMTWRAYLSQDGDCRGSGALNLCSLCCPRFPNVLCRVPVHIVSVLCFDSSLQPLTSRRPHTLVAELLCALVLAAELLHAWACYSPSCQTHRSLARELPSSDMCSGFGRGGICTCVPTCLPALHPGPRRSTQMWRRHVGPGAAPVTDTPAVTEDR